MVKLGDAVAVEASAPLRYATLRLIHDSDSHLLNELHDEPSLGGEVDF